jgi:hypothetical protein
VDTICGGAVTVYKRSIYTFSPDQVLRIPGFAAVNSVEAGPNAGMDIAAAVAHQGSVEAVRQHSEIINGYLGREFRLLRWVLPWTVRSSIHPLEKAKLLQGRIVLENSLSLNNIPNVRG